MGEFVGVGFDCALDFRQVDCVFSLSAYEGDLGMRTRTAVHRQLEIDLPRSRVCVGAHRAMRAREITAATSHPKLCTQAVLAPVVEWYLAKGIVAHDAGEPMCVSVGDRGRRVRVTKTLGLRTWSEVSRGRVRVTIDADGPHNSLVVNIATL